jgi:outer membrane protein assembly factor BamB
MAAGISVADKRRGEGIRRVDMTPAVANGTVYIGSGDQSFYAIDATTGKKKWSYVAGPGMVSSNYTSYPVPAAVLKNGIVYFVTEDGLHALDALTGNRKWLFETLQEIPKQKYMPRKRAPEGPVMGDGVIFLTAWPRILGNTPLKSFVYAVDPESGKAKWVTSVDGLDITAPATAKGLVFFAVEEPAPLTSHSNRATLYAINAADGQVKWKFGADNKGYGTAQGIIADNTIYFRTAKSLLAVELETGRQLWSFSADDIRGGLRVDDKHLYAITHKGTMARPDDTLHALALTNGHEKWSRGLSDNAHTAMVHDGVVYGGIGPLRAIDAATGKELWSFKGTGRESARLISGGRIFLTSPTVTFIQSTRVDQGYLYAIDAKTGKLNP